VKDILRRIYGAVRTEEGLRTRNNDELEKLERGEDVVKYVKTKRISWWGHPNKMTKTKTGSRITEWNPIGMRSKGHSKNTREIKSEEMDITHQRQKSLV
jgi:hypothetical protein